MFFYWIGVDLNVFIKAKKVIQLPFIEVCDVRYLVALSSYMGITPIPPYNECNTLFCFIVKFIFWWMDVSYVENIQQVYFNRIIIAWPLGHEILN